MNRSSQSIVRKGCGLSGLNDLNKFIISHESLFHWKKKYEFSKL